MVLLNSPCCRIWSPSSMVHVPLGTRFHTLRLSVVLISYSPPLSFRCHMAILWASWYLLRLSSGRSLSTPVETLALRCFSFNLNLSTPSASYRCSKDSHSHHRVLMIRIFCALFTTMQSYPGIVSDMLMFPRDPRAWISAQLCLGCLGSDTSHSVRSPMDVRPQPFSLWLHATRRRLFLDVGSG